MHFQCVLVSACSGFNMFSKLRGFSAHVVLDMFGIQRVFILLLFLVDALLDYQRISCGIF